MIVAQSDFFPLESASTFGRQQALWKNLCKSKLNWYFRQVGTLGRERGIPHICHGHTDGVRGEKKLSCGEISNFCTWTMWRNIKFLHMWINFTFHHMTDVEKSGISFIMCTIYGILLHFTLLCCKKLSFLAIYAVLSQVLFFAIFALLCGEKFSQKKMAVEKK